MKTNFVFLSLPVGPVMDWQPNVLHFSTKLKLA